MDAKRQADSTSAAEDRAASEPFSPVFRLNMYALQLVLLICAAVVLWRGLWNILDSALPNETWANLACILLVFVVYISFSTLEDQTK